MPTIDLTATRTDLIFAVDNDKILTAGPFIQSGAVLSAASKQLRIVIKASETTADTSAAVDKSSVLNPTIVYKIGTDAEGTWGIDLRGILPVVGQYWYRIDLCDVTSVDTDRQIVAKGTLTVKAV